MKVLLADDHVLFREGVGYVLAGLTLDHLDVLEVGNIAQAEQAIRRNPDIGLVLLDLSMPGIDGLTGLQVLRRLAPDVPMIVLTASEDTRHVRRALQLGARGYITKSSSSEAMLAGIRAVMAGRVHVSPNLDGREPRGRGGDVLRQLTPRQIDVLGMLREGKSNKEIGRELDLAEITVKMHVTAILKALEVQNRTQAAIVADQLDL